MWKANGKTTTLLLFLDSLFPKTEIIYARCFLWRQNGSEINYSHIRISGGGLFLGEISSSKHYSKKENARFGRGLGPVVRQTTDE
jgi:hypothetical protein